MASTNKTPNLNLSQFIATDKPAWLTDVNGDMSKIDTAVKNVSDRVGVNETAITEAEANIEDNANNITALQASSSQHGTDITDLKAQDIIIKNDVTNLGTRVTALENDTNYDLLWTNSNPSAPYQANSINLDYSGYKFLLIVFKNYTTNQTWENTTLIRAVTSTQSHSISLDGGRIRYRGFGLISSGVDFGGGYSYENYGTSAVDNNCNIPYQIYGIK